MSCAQTTSATAPCAQSRSGHKASPGAVWLTLGRTLAAWFTRYRTRRVLRELDVHLLKDIGLTPAQAAREAAKPFWIE